jgi:hypothetical protein
MREQKRYIKRNNLKDGSHLEVSVYYNEGKNSYFTGQALQGYYLRVRSVYLYEGTVRYNLSQGYKKLILKTNRYSDEQFDKAIEIAKVFEGGLITNAIRKETM